ncbi:MAG: general stress protein CsbD [Bacteroidota bacterium]
MATRQMNESWKRVRSQIESIWSEQEFTDSDMKKARGNLPKMINLIHEKTGESRAEIMQKMSAII